MVTSGFGLYGHIRANRIRGYLLVAGLFLLVPLVFFGLMLTISDAKRVSQAIAIAWGRTTASLPYLMVGTLIWVGIGYSRNVSIIGRMVGAAAASGDDARRLLRLVQPLCISRGMTVPQLAVMPSAALNAFASGVNDSQYTITVTRGLLDALDDRELEAVLAHELTHIRNDDVRLMIFAVLIAGVASFFGEMLFRMMVHAGSRARSQVRIRKSSGSKKGGSAAALLGIVAIILAWVLAMLIRMALSRSREYLADAGAVELTKNPDALISALAKISGRAELEGVPSGVMDMCIENKKNGIGDLFATHPDIEDRIRALVTMAGGNAAAALAATPALQPASVPAEAPAGFGVAEPQETQVATRAGAMAFAPDGPEIDADEAALRRRMKAVLS